MDPEAARGLARELAQTAPLWRPVPFHDDPPWVTDTPALAGVLLSLDDKHLEQLAAQPEDLQHWMSAQVPQLAGLFRAAAGCVDKQPPPLPLDEPERLGRDVPGRKWQQVLHFAAACETPAIARHGDSAPLAGTRVDARVDTRVEWCSGKAHLGRLLARRSHLPTTAIEWSGELCAEGARLAARDGLPVTFRQADALQVSAKDAGLTPHAHAVALHACGDLHVALIDKAAAAGIAALDIAPCCYHLMRAAHWQPLSATLAGCGLAQWPLTREDLRLAVQETVTSSARVVKQQREMAAWRLGFDALQRDLRGVDAYLPTPSRPARVLAAGFAAFCADLAAHHRLALPAGIDFALYLHRGHQRHARVRRLELLRHACRRALETLIVVDRALFLAEQGYDVCVRTFCPRPLTPRNLLIQARRPAGQPDGVRVQG